MKNMMPVENMKDMGKRFEMMGAMMGMDMEIVKVSDAVLHFKTSKCPLGIEGTSKELCKAMMTSDREMISEALGRKVKMEIPKSVAAGDEYCEIIFSK